MARSDWAALLAAAVQITYRHDTRPFLSLAKGLARQTSTVCGYAHECIIPHSTCRGVLTDLYPHSSNTTKCGVWVWPLGRAPVVASCTTGQYHDIALAIEQYHIYCPGGTFDLCHRWDTNIDDLLSVQVSLIYYMELWFECPRRCSWDIHSCLISGYPL